LPRLFAAFTALALLGGCSGCKDKPGTPAVPKTGAPVTAPAPDAWLRGELPKEINEGTPVSGGTFTVRVTSEPAGLNRLHDQMAEGWMFKYTNGTVYETLAELDRDSHPRYELKPLLAESWEISPDHLTNTVHLRKGVKFHNGEVFSSRDVKAVLDAVMNPSNLTTTVRSYFLDLEKYETPDEHTVVLHWKKPYFLSFRNFATALPMMPASALKGDWNTLPINRSPIGTGPFKFESWEASKTITFARNDEYWGKKPYLDKFVVRIVKDHTVATQMWERGEFDLMTQVQPAVWRSVEAADPRNDWAVKGYNRIYFLENIYSWIAWNEERPMFKDRRVRTALAMLFPYEQVAKNVDMDLELPTTCPYYRESESCDATVARLAYDPRGAAKLLEEAGWKDTNGDGVLDREGVPFKATFLVNPHSVKMGKLVPLLQEEYRKVGIELDIEKAETAVYMERLRSHEFDVGSMLWSSQDPQQDQFQVFHSSQAAGGSNYVSYKSDEVDKLLEQIRTEFDAAARANLERRVHRLVYQDQVYNFMTNRPSLDAAKRRVHGLRPSLTWYDLRTVWLAPDASAPAEGQK
jgi:peptide/nickel transport system substrate-binding protein